MPQFTIECRFLPGDRVRSDDGRNGEIVELIYRRRSSHSFRVAEWSTSRPSEWNSYLVMFDDGDTAVVSEERLEEGMS